MKINLTIDHRFTDAGAGVKCFKAVGECISLDYKLYGGSRSVRARFTEAENRLILIIIKSIEILRDP